MKKVETITPKNICMIITSLARSRFSCVPRFYKGNDGAGINIRDIILTVADIFDILSDIFLD